MMCSMETRQMVRLLALFVGENCFHIGDWFYDSWVCEGFQS